MTDTTCLTEIHKDTRGYDFYPDSALPIDLPEEFASFDDLVIFEHYFIAGLDWYVHCFDPESGIAFGYVLNGANPEFSEWGSIYLPELERLSTPIRIYGVSGETTLSVCVERETGWFPQPFREVQATWTNDA